MMNLLHISDTHQHHENLILPTNLDVIIHSGDATNNRSKFINHNEFLDFVDWYSKIDIPYKLFVAGNHDVSLAENKRESKKILKDNNIIYLEDEPLEINGIKFYGTPYTPTFGDWVFNRGRDKMYKVWDMVPTDTQVLITHGPPKGLLDLTENRDHSLEMVGDKSIHNYFDRWTQLKYICCGHVHNCGNIINAATKTYKHFTVSNAAAVEDGKFSKGIVHHGNLLSI